MYSGCTLSAVIMDPSTSQHRQEAVQPTAVVTSKDSEKWAKVLAHFHKVGHQDISFAHMTLLEEVHYTRNPAGGGWKAASWVFKMRSGAVYATADEAVTFMRHKLQDPATRAAATTEAAALAAQHSAASGAHAGSTARGLAPSTSIRGQQHAQATAKQGVRTAAAPCEQPPAKKQRSAQQGGTAAVAAAASALKQRPAVMQQASGQLDAATRAPYSKAGAAAASTGAGREQQPVRPLLLQDSTAKVSDLSRSSSQGGLASSAILFASGALVRCFPHTAGPGNRPSRGTPGVSCSSRVLGNGVSGRPQPKRQQLLVQELPPPLQQQGQAGTSSDEGCSLADRARAWQAQQQQQPRQRQQQLQELQQQQQLPQQHGADDAAGGAASPACPRLVYDVRRRSRELDLHTALEITAAQYMEWLAATGAQSIPGDGEELARCLLDGDDPIVQLKGITPAAFTELRGVLPANFAPIVQGHRRAEHSDDADEQPPPPPQQQQHQQQDHQHVKPAAATAGAAAAACRTAGRGWEEGQQHRAGSDSTYDGTNDSPNSSNRGSREGSSGSEATDPGMECEASPADDAVSLPGYLRGASAAKQVAGRAVGACAAPVRAVGACAGPARQTSFSSASSCCVAPPAPAAASARKPAATGQHASRLGLTSAPYTGSSTIKVAGGGAAGGDAAADAQVGVWCGPLAGSSTVAGAAVGEDAAVDVFTSARQQAVRVGVPCGMHTGSGTAAGAAGAAAVGDVAVAAAAAGLQVQVGVPLKLEAVPGSGNTTPTMSEADTTERHPFGDAYSRPVQQQLPGPAFASFAVGSFGTGHVLKSRDPRARLWGAAAAAGVLHPCPPIAQLSAPAAAAAPVVYQPPPATAQLSGPAAAAAATGVVLLSPPAAAAPAVVPLPPTQQFGGLGEVSGPAGGMGVAEGQVPGPAEGFYSGGVGGPGDVSGPDVNMGQAGGPGEVDGLGDVCGPDVDMGQAGGPGAGLPGPDTDMGQAGGPGAGMPGPGGERGEAGGSVGPAGGPAAAAAAPAAGPSGHAAAAPPGAAGAALGDAAAWGGAPAAAAAPAGAAAAAAAPAGAAEGPAAGAAAQQPPGGSINPYQQALAAMRAEVERVQQERDAAMELCVRYQEEIRRSRAVFGLLGLPVDGQEAGEGRGEDAGGGGGGGGDMQE